MPHAGTASTRRDQSTVESVGDDFASTDEVKVYKDEGDEEHRSSENLSEDKLGLVTETEEGSRTSDVDGNANKNSAKPPDYRLPDHLLFGYPFLSSYPYANCPGLTAPGKLFGHHPGLSLYMYNNDPIVGQPPPAHSGILPLHVDPKTGLPRTAFYGLPPPGRLYGSEFNHLQFDLMAQTNAAAAAAAAAGLFGGPLSNPLSSWFAGGPPPPSAGLLTSHPQPPPGIGHPASSSGPVQDLSLSSTSNATSIEGSSLDQSRQQPSNRTRPGRDPPDMSSPRSARTFDPTFQTYNSDDSGNPLLHASRHRSSTTSGTSAVAGFNTASAAAEPWSSAVAIMTSDRQQFLLRYSQHHRHHQQHQLQQLEQQQQQQHQQQTTAKQRRSQLQRQHVKKPLNAFMIFMKEMRQSVIDQCTLKESAAINQILGRRLRDRTNGDDVTSGPSDVTPLWRLPPSESPSAPSRHFRSQYGVTCSSLAGRLERKRAYVKKPLNAFMLFMKEMRQKVIDECTLKESAAINQILGRKWHALDRSEQAKYYDMARKEKELHMQLYPGWSARDNYATHTKKKKLKRDPQRTDSERITALTGIDFVCPNMRKCRSRYGVEQQNSWCKICRFDGNSSSAENSLVSSPFPSLNDAADSPPYHSVHSASSLPPDLKGMKYVHISNERTGDTGLRFSCYPLAAMLYNSSSQQSQLYGCSGEDEDQDDEDHGGVP